MTITLGRYPRLWLELGPIIVIGFRRGLVTRSIGLALTSTGRRDFHRWSRGANDIHARGPFRYSRTTEAPPID